MDRRIHRKHSRRTGLSAQRVEATWPRHGENIHEYPTSANGLWWNQSQNGHALDVLVNLHVQEDMKTTTMYTGSVAGRQQDTADANAKANPPVKDADEQLHRRWMESPAPS